mmetsp:Transcript_15190/g.22385  ORF Transcript_15190/g.22385 Transcript_15190/m.22385 type:complete len:317 (-) Transcript_15190:227-1177(-)
MQLLIPYIVFSFCVNGIFSVDTNTFSSQHTKLLFDDSAIIRNGTSEDHHDTRSLQEPSANQIVRFVAFGDTPHGDQERKRFPLQLDRLESRSDFLLHLGDIHERQQECDLTHFDEAAEALRHYTRVPTFIIPGEVDWYTCLNQEDAWTRWSQHFLNFQDNWNHQFNVRHQKNRPENFAFFHKGVLFVGFHIISATVLDWGAWKEQVQDDVLWLEKEVVSNAFSDSTTAIVFVAHAKPHHRRYRAFYEAFIQVTANIKKPLLYLHTDEQEFQIARDFPVKNILRVAVGRGGDEDPLEITVDPSSDIPFTVKRRSIPE